MRAYILASIACLAVGCAGRYAYTNQPLQGERDADDPPVRASLNIKDQRGNERVLFILAISGGGSRAAYFGGACMLQLEEVFKDINLLHEVDAISAVSGGGLPAAYYCISQDATAQEARPFIEVAADLSKKLLLLKQAAKEGKAPAGPPKTPREMSAAKQTPAPSGHIWNKETVKANMQRNFIGPWGRKMFWPRAWWLFLFTAYDRSDMMAEVFSDALFDFGMARLGQDLEFKHLNPSRPYLILNATNATANTPDEETFGSIFTFTDEDFKRYLKSDIQQYEVGRAVMGSSTFPGVFNYMTLRDFRGDESAYMNVFDGGCSDNLGLDSAKRIILSQHERYRNIIVISIDAHTEPGGVPRDVYDTRRFIDYAVDSNFMDTYNTLLETGRERVLAEFRNRVFNAPQRPQALDLSNKMIFFHASFDKVTDPKLRAKLNEIPTTFKIRKEDADLIDQAVPEIIQPDEPLLGVIKWLVTHDAEQSPPLAKYRDGASAP